MGFGSMTDEQFAQKLQDEQFAQELQEQEDEAARKREFEQREAEEKNAMAAASLAEEQQAQNGEPPLWVLIKQQQRLVYDDLAQMKCLSPPLDEGF